ncbi:hypothetical protein SDC9_145939 [bioreactor metagenome]|uniref:Uncharacterized protein n=1 Tax=bioreactor metagenome TaxID=1076179 RepID=A0A645EBR2_9ZZZZ
MVVQLTRDALALLSQRGRHLHRTARLAVQRAHHQPGKRQPQHHIQGHRQLQRPRPVREFGKKSAQAPQHENALKPPGAGAESKHGEKTQVKHVRPRSIFANVRLIT